MIDSVCGWDELHSWDQFSASYPYLLNISEIISTSVSAAAIFSADDNWGFPPNRKDIVNVKERSHFRALCSATDQEQQPECTSSLLMLVLACLVVESGRAELRASDPELNACGGILSSRICTPLVKALTIFDWSSAPQLPTLLSDSAPVGRRPPHRLSRCDHCHSGRYGSNAISHFPGGKQVFFFMFWSDLQDERKRTAASDACLASA